LSPESITRESLSSDNCFSLSCCLIRECYPSDKL